MSALRPLNNDEVISVDDHVKKSENLKNPASSITFDYKLSDKSAKLKLLKASKRKPIEEEENSTSTNLIFSAGAWYHVVLPSIQYWNEVGENSCKVGDYEIKVGGVQYGKENHGKHVNTKIVFLADRSKIVCHLYNTTQIILINGHGYRKFIDLFLKPFFASKVAECIDNVEQFNDEVVKKLGTRTVKRTNIKFKRGPAFPCHSCDFAAKSISTLKRHKKNGHGSSFNLSRINLSVPRESTRNNSIVESLMVEDMTISELSAKNVSALEENCLKYTCNDCMFVTNKKASIDDHVKTTHRADQNEEVRFVCMVCNQELKEANEYEKHIKSHETPVRIEVNFEEIQYVVYNYILEHFINEIKNETVVPTYSSKN